MAETTDAGYRHPLAGPRLGFLQTLVGGHAGAKDRRHLREIDAGRQARGKRCRCDDIFSEAAVAAVTGVMLVLAKRLPAGLAVFATHAGIVQPGDADRIALLEVGHARAERGDHAGDFMPGNERRHGLYRPISIGGMQIGMANAARNHLDQISPGPGTGTGTCSIDSGLPNSWTTAAFIIFTTVHSPCFTTAFLAAPPNNGPRHVLFP